MSRTRCFIGVEIGEEIRRKAAALQQKLASTGAQVKWVSPESMHITLLFLGEVDDRDLPAVCKAIEKCAKREPAFPMRVSGVGAFPTIRRPKVIWGGITDGVAPLRRLYESLEAKLLELNLFRREERGYTPHLTVGRVRGEDGGQTLVPELTKLLAWEGGRTQVSEVLLFSSEQTREGPEYSVLARCELTGA